MEKLKKCISILMFVIILGISICSNAKSETGWIFRPDGTGYWGTTINDYGDAVFCIEMGQDLRRDSYDDTLPGLYNNGEIYCSTDDPGTPKSSKSWYESNTGWTSEFEVEMPVAYKLNQDVAYALASHTSDFSKKQGQSSTASQEQIQTVIWRSELGGEFTVEAIRSHADESAAKGSGAGYVPADELYDESAAYKAFYEEKEANGGFKPIDATNYGGVKTIVNQNDDTYIVGPFNINYTQGIYKRADGTVVKFGYIDELKLIDQDGNDNVNILDLITTDGESITKREPDYPFPNTEEDFYIKFKYDGKGDVNKVHMKVHFTYLDECQASMVKWSGTSYEWGYVKKFTGYQHDAHCILHIGEDYSYYTHENCKSAFYYEMEKAPYTSEWDKLGTEEPQDMLTVEPIGDDGSWATPVWKETEIDSKDNEVDITMELQGIVFIDKQAEKDMTNLNGINGIFDGIDEVLPNIVVTLYEENGTLAKLAPGKDGEIRTNPTLTDANGHYEFKGMDAQKKYYVTYKVNGQRYENTQYMFDMQKYNTKEWEVFSLATLLDSDRLAYNNKFAQINSAPANYTSINNITGFGLTQNKTYNLYEQTYNKAQKEADDIKTLQDAIIRKIKEYISQNKEYPNDAEMTRIYQAVRNENRGISEVENKIQYIVDMEVIATTGQGNTKQLYPVYDKFVIDDKPVTIGKETYKPIYNGQKHINFGAMEREIFDLKLTKDLYQIKVTINGKDYIYSYNSRNQETVTVELRGTDIEAYERDLRKSDIRYINYINYNNEKKLRVYVTYKIRITNQSDSPITGYVTQLNDFYDSDYTYLDSHLVEYNETGIKADNQLNWQNDTINHKLTTKDMNLANAAINVSEYIDIYNQFEVNTDALERLLTQGESTKENYAEIAGYRTVYQNLRRFPNGTVINYANRVAGLVDRDSRPGDFEVTNEVRNFVNYSYTNSFKSMGGEDKTKASLDIFQDDADKAPGLKLILLNIMRELNGNVWEDSVLSDILKNENIRRGDGLNNDNNPIQGMKVELVTMDETVSNNENTQYGIVTDIYNIYTDKFEQAVTYTSADGKYRFEGYIPGNYLIRFTYGEGNTLTIDSNGKVYNGQDYKSTLYDESKHSLGNSRSENYWYDKANDNESDAHDNWVLRNRINENNATMNNHIATVLDYQTTRNGANASTLAELQNRTMLFADTPKLVLEVEYAKSESSYTVNVKEYKVNNIDFGIVERPRSELTLVKDIENIRIIANEGTTIFDAENQTTNLAWIKPSTVPYNELHGFVQATMDENLMHGATVKILYRFTVTNTGEKDYLDIMGNVDRTFYNTGRPAGTLATTNATYIVDYVENNLKFSPDAQLDNIDKDKGYNRYWTEVTNKSELNDGTINRLVEIDNNILNGYTTIIKTTNDSPLLKQLKPANRREESGESTSTTLLLTKVLNTNSDSTDNLTYNNSAEIVQTYNPEGRRSYNNRDKSDYTNDSISNTVKSIPGNYDPTTVASISYASEPDTDLAETVTILPPFGEESKTLFIIGIVFAVIILAGGIYIIKRKVINNR